MTVPIDFEALSNAFQSRLVTLGYISGTVRIPRVIQISNNLRDAILAGRFSAYLRADDRITLMCKPSVICGSITTIVIFPTLI